MFVLSGSSINQTIETSESFLAFGCGIKSVSPQGRACTMPALSGLLCSIKAGDTVRTAGPLRTSRESSLHI